MLETNESCVEDSLWTEEATDDENGKKLIEICKKCLMINPLERYHDGGQLLNALEDLAEDAEDLERKERDRKMLFSLQSWLLQFNRKNVRSDYRQDREDLTHSSNRGRTISQTSNTFHRSSSHHQTSIQIPSSGTRFTNALSQRPSEEAE